MFEFVYVAACRTSLPLSELHMKMDCVCNTLWELKLVNDVDYCILVLHRSDLILYSNNCC